MKIFGVMLGLLLSAATWGGRVDARSMPVAPDVSSREDGGARGQVRRQRQSRAQGVGADGGRKVVLVVSKSRPLDGLRQALASQLVSTGAELALEKVDHLPTTMAARFARVLAAGTDPSLVLVAWCERMDDAGDVLDVLDARHRRILLRRVKSCSGTEGAEEAALIVRTAVDVLLSGGAVGVALKRTAQMDAGAKTISKTRPRPLSRAASGPVHRSRPRVSEEVRDEGLSGKEGMQKRPAVDLAARLAFRLDNLALALPADPAGGVGFLVRLHEELFGIFNFWMASPASRNLRFVSLSLRRYSVEAGVAYHWHMGRWHLGLGGTLVGEVRQFEMQGAPDVVLGPLVRVDGLVGAAAQFRVALSLTENLGLFVFVGGQVTLWGPSKYLVEQPDGEKVLAYDWWPVQPLSGIGLDIRLK